MNTNIVILTGRLTKDPIANTEVCKFTLAVNGYKEKVNFPQIVAFKKTAELCAKYLTKGSLVTVVGSLTTGSYDDKKTGATVYTTDVIANQVEFLSTKPREEQKEEKKLFEDERSDFEPLDDEEMPF